jgi:hypothetical protein
MVSKSENAMSSLSMQEAQLKRTSKQATKFNSPTHTQMDLEFLFPKEL